VLAASTVALMLVGAAVAIGVESVREIRTPHRVPAAWTLVVLVAVVIVKWVLARRVGALGADIGSAAVQADAWHHLSDAITSGAAFIGILAAVVGWRMTGDIRWAQADDWAALLAAGVIGYNGISMLRPSLVDIVRYHHAKYGVEELGMPTGLDIPIGARIVCIADAYDAMVSDRVYRKGRSQEAAFAELRCMASIQFDPELVERFIATVQNRRAPSAAGLGPVSKDLALNLGLQTERLAAAADGQDFTTIRAVAMHLKSTAEAHGLAPLAEAATLISDCQDDSDLPQVIEIIHEIIDLSLAAQQAYLAMDSDMAQVALARCQALQPENLPIS
jgi:hypothetical protein